MSLDLTVQYPGKIGPATAAFPYGEPRNITAPSDGTGTPWEAAIVKDTEGFKQALLKSAGIVPSGTPDQVAASEYLQSVVGLASGRAFTYDEAGIADAYVVNARTDQEAPGVLFDGMLARFTPGNTNTGGSTVNVGGLGVKTLLMPDGVTALFAGILTTTKEVEIKYDGTNFILNTDIVFGTHTTVSIATSTQGAIESIPHGLGTDDIDFGGSVIGSGTGNNPWTVTITMIGNDKRYNMIGNSLQQQSASIIGSSVGQIDLTPYNNSTSQAQTITLNWWASRRNA